MTAIRRIRMKARGAALAVGALLAVPATAQNSEQPVDVTAAPPPSSGTVGPSQLRDFSIGGQVSRPVPQPAQPVPAPSSATQAPPADNPPASSRPERPTAGRAVASPETRQAAPQSPPTPSTNRATATPDVEAPTAAATDSVDVAPPEAAAPAPVTAEPTSVTASGLSPWPWLVALLAALGAGAFWWFRRNRDRRYADPGRMAFAAAGADVATMPSPRAIPTPPTPAPKAPAQPPVAAPVAPPVPAPAPAPKPKSDGLITSSALKPAIELRFVPDRVVIDGRDAIVQFDVIVANVGSAPARNILVEALMVCASPTQDQEIAEYFRRPNTLGDRIPGIAPMDSLTLKSAVKLPLDEVKSFEAGGRKLFVPLVAFNVVYGASDQQVSASFLVGRGKEGDAKLAPFRLDLGPRIFRGLAARPHSSGLSAAA